MNEEQTIEEWEIIPKEWQEETKETTTEWCDLEIFYVKSPWCTPCKQQTPVVEELAEKYKVTIKDIDDPENMKWAIDENIQSTPTILVRYYCPQTVVDKGFIDKYFQWFTLKEDIISYIENGK